MGPCVSDLLPPRPSTSWSSDRGRRTSSPTTAREQAEPWRRCLVTLLGGVPGQIRRTGLGRRPITGSRLRPLLRQGPHRTGRPTGRPSDDGGTSGHTVGPRRVTAGNGRERQRTARTIAWTQPSISSSIGWTAGRPRLHSPGQLHASTLEVAAAAASKPAPHRCRSTAAISVSAEELPMS